MGVYLNENPAAVAATVALLKHYRAFVRSDCGRMRDPEHKWPPHEYNRDQAQNRLSYLVNMAINRKAGILDPEHLTGVQLDDVKRQARRVWLDDPELPAHYGHFSPVMRRLMRRLVKAYQTGTKPYGIKQERVKRNVTA